jgi:hypothetical protein
MVSVSLRYVFAMAIQEEEERFSLMSFFSYFFHQILTGDLHALAAIVQQRRCKDTRWDRYQRGLAAMHIVSDEVMRGCVQNGYPHRFANLMLCRRRKMRRSARACASLPWH